MGREKTTEKIILSISLLVSNRKKYIRKTMESVKMLMEQVPCELIVVDTVGEENSDGSLAIAREYADKVIYFPWRNDFAAARNAGLKEAVGEWFLYLDDDEWFEDVTEFIHFFQSGEHQAYDRGWYVQRNYTSIAGNQYEDVFVDRICRIGKTTSFYGIIHESIMPLGENVKKFSVYVHHYGYVYANEEEKQRHSNRNVNLLKQYLEENPKDFRMMGQLVQEYVGIEKYDAARKVCCLATADGEFSSNNVFLQYLLVMLFRIEVYQNDWEKADSVYRELVEKKCLRELPAFVCLTELITVKEKLEKYAELLDALKEYFVQKDKLNVKKDAWEEQAVFDFLTYMSEEKEKEVVEKGIYATAMSGNCELAKKLLDKVNWLDEVNRPYGPMCWLVELYEKTGRADLFFPYANQIVQNEKMKTQFAILLNNMQRKYVPMEEQNAIEEKHIKLTIGMLVSNHVQYIRKAMEALKPLLEAVPSELVVLDTKGEETDGSIDIVREYTDKIYPFTWCDDFSAARNACLSHAKGEWFLYQDDDEWFDNVQEFVDFFKSGECEKYQSGYYYTKDYDAAGNSVKGIASRMIRRKESTCFIGKIHEAFNEFPAPSKYFNCFTHHMGYVFSSPESRKEHQERNKNLLMAELRDKGYTARICVQIVQEFLNSEETIEEGRKFAWTAIKELEKTGQLETTDAQWILAAIVRGCSMAKDYEKLLAQAKKIRAEYRRSRVTELVISAELVKNAFVHRDYKLVQENVESYLEQWDWLQCHEQEAKVLMQLDFPSFCTEEYYFSMLHAGAKAANYQGDYQAAMAYWNRFPWSKEGGKAGKYLADFQVTREGLRPKQSALIKNDIKLTIGMLVSNHVQYIRKVMEALKPLLEAVPSELIVLDTKGEETDGSIDIVREYTDKIYPFTWCNDFSAARNACLSYAKGEWFLYQDDDEWFDNVQEFIDFFKSGECEKYYSGYYYTKDYNASGGSSMAIAGRMIRRTENTRFVGRVHETFNEVFGPNKLFQCFTHHMGYAFSTPESRRLHQIRNVSILKEELKDKGYIPRICAQMAQELLYVDETAEKGLEFAKKSIAELGRKGMLEDSCSQWLLTATVRYYVKYGTYEQVKKQAKEIRREYNLSKMAELALAAVTARAAGEHGDLGYLLENTSRYISNWDWLQAHPEEALLQTQMDFPRYFTKEYYYDILKVGAIAENHRGNYESAKEYWDRFPWEETGFDGSPYYGDLQVTYAGLKEARRQKKEEEDRAELEKMYAVLYEAEPVVRQYILEERMAEVVELLTGMQEIIITLGNKLDALSKYSEALIHKLEHCCELIWQCANATTKETSLDILDDVIKKLQDVEKLM